MKSRTAIVDALRAAAAALELEPDPVEPEQPRPRYYTRSTAPIEARVWDRAIREIRAFRPGREIMVLADELHAWIEQHPIERTTSEAANDDAPLPFSMLAGGHR